MITASPRLRALMLFSILLPFWTSLLARTSAWIVVLQREGIINGSLGSLGLISEPLELVFNRFGVYVSMIHILLPFMVLPLFSVMKGITPNYMRASAVLGAHPLEGFLRVYFPLSLPGVSAGCLLTFIVCAGFYVTPSLVGGAADQMIGYFIAFYTNTRINWGMAAALSLVTLICVLGLYIIIGRWVGISRVAGIAR